MSSTPSSKPVTDLSCEELVEILKRENVSGKILNFISENVLTGRDFSHPRFVDENILIDDVKATLKLLPAHVSTLRQVHQSLCGLPSSSSESTTSIPINSSSSQTQLPIVLNTAENVKLSNNNNNSLVVQPQQLSSKTNCDPDKFCHNCNLKGHIKAACPHPKMTRAERKQFVQSRMNNIQGKSSNVVEKSQQPGNVMNVCYNCHERGHEASLCPHGKMTYEQRRELCDVKSGIAGTRRQREEEKTTADNINDDLIEIVSDGHYDDDAGGNDKDLSVFAFGLDTSSDPKREMINSSASVPLLVRRCHNCLQNGHIKAQCPHPKMTRADRKNLGQS